MKGLGLVLVLGDERPDDSSPRICGHYGRRRICVSPETRNIARPFRLVIATETCPVLYFQTWRLLLAISVGRHVGCLKLLIL